MSVLLCRKGASGQARGSSKGFRPGNGHTSKKKPDVSDVKRSTPAPQARKQAQPISFRAPDSEELDSLNWNSETMKPSAALQDRLRDLRQPTQNLVSALPEETVPAVEMPVVEDMAEKTGWSL